MEAGRLCRTCRLRPPPSVFKVNWPKGPREGGLGHWFLFHAEKELAAGAAKLPSRKKVFFCTPKCGMMRTLTKCERGRTTCCD